jgi:hypothetical protein
MAIMLAASAALAPAHLAGAQYVESALTMQTAAETASDFVAFPPVRREVVSHGKKHILVLESPDKWKSKYALATLFDETPSGRKRVWQRKLPHEYGPRYAVLGDRGQVTLFDEWINVKSRYAVNVINAEKNLDIVWDFDAVAAKIGVPVASLVETATSGWWIRTPPVIDAAGERAIVGTADKCLVVELDTGELKVRDAGQKNRC